LNGQRILLLIAIAGGVASGSSALSGAASSQPPLTWADLIFILCGSAFAVVAVVGLQMLRRDRTAVRLGTAFFFYSSVYLVAVGLSAFAIALRGVGLVPHSLLFVCAGLGALGGVALVRVVFARGARL
jgi:hypothetical protein